MRPWCSLKYTTFDPSLANPSTHTERSNTLYGQPNNSVMCERDHEIQAPKQPGMLALMNTMVGRYHEVRLNYISYTSPLTVTYNVL